MCEAHIRVSRCVGEVAWTCGRVRVRVRRVCLVGGSRHETRGGFGATATFHPPLGVNVAYTRRDNRDAVATGTIRGAARGRARTSAFGQPPRSPSQPSSFRSDAARSSPRGERAMVRSVRTSDSFRPSQTGGSDRAVTFRNPEGNAGMRLERDPAAFLIRSNVALEVLTQLRDGRPQRPSEVRRALGGMHPQILPRPSTIWARSGSPTSVSFRDRSRRR